MRRPVRRIIKDISSMFSWMPLGSVSDLRAYFMEPHSCDLVGVVGLKRAKHFEEVGPWEQQVEGDTLHSGPRGTEEPVWAHALEP